MWHSTCLAANDCDLGSRLDRFLTVRWSMPFSLSQRLIRQKDIQLWRRNDTDPCTTLTDSDLKGYEKLKNITSSTRLQMNDIIRCKSFLFKPSSIKESTVEALNWSEEEITSLKQSILHSNPDLFVMNKPAGVAVSPCSGKNITSILSHLKLTETDPIPFTVHRLDMETTGCLVLARHRLAARQLSEAFAHDHEMIKTYEALIRGTCTSLHGRIETESCVEMKQAVTEYRVLNQFRNITHVEFRPVTGRKHQLRLHAQRLAGCIVGDQRYSSRESGPLMLHCRQWQWRSLLVTAPFPFYWLKFMNTLK